MPTAPAKQQSATVQASHLLVKHRDSRRPSSWREENITRSKEEAMEILKGKVTEVRLDCPHRGLIKVGVYGNLER